jgi:hypothetical protein
VPATAQAEAILKYAHETAAALLSAFGTIRSKRRVKAGAPTDEEQDLLRAMLLFAAAGLDSMLKQLVRDCLPYIALHDQAARAEFEAFVVRHLRGEAEEELAGASPKVLARLLTRDSPQAALIDGYVESLTAGSLQSTEQLYKVVKALGVPPSDAGLDAKRMRPIVEARNQITHEMDIDFDHKTRNRRARQKPMMIEHTNVLLETADNVLRGVAAKLVPGIPSERPTY